MFYPLSLIHLMFLLCLLRRALYAFSLWNFQKPTINLNKDMTLFHATLEGNSES